MYQSKISEENDKYSLIVKKAGFKTLTPFQKKVADAASANKYIIAEITEGCGKTLGMAIPVIINTDFSFPGLKSIIIASSYENVTKINAFFTKLFNKKVTSLQSIAANPDRNIKKDLHMLEKQPDIFITTTDSIIDQIRSNNISLEGIQSFIIEDSNIDDYYSFEKDMEFIFSKLSGRQLFIVFTKQRNHGYSFYKLFKKPITIKCTEMETETGEEKTMDNSFIKNIVSEIKETSDIKSLDNIKKLIKKNVPFFMRGYFSAWLLEKYAMQKGYNAQINSGKDNSDVKTIFINTGKSKKFYAKDIVGMILSSKTAEKSDLKHIRVFDSYSFIDVTSSKADAVINVINTVTFKGKKLSADFAKKQQK